MDSSEFRIIGKEMVDYIANYMEHIQEKKVFPSVKPGYLKKILPEHAPTQPEDWEAVMKDVEDKIMPGMVHWAHPQFHAYYPSGNSFPSILGDMLSNAFGTIGFSWASSPACTELEIIILDWIAKMIDLPDIFLSKGEGGGSIQGSASESVLLTLLAARTHIIRTLKEKEPELYDDEILPRLVCYCSTDAHSCMEKAAMIALIELHQIEPDLNRSMRGDALKKAIEDDLKNGMIPFYVQATLGTTASCAFDNISEIGPLCKKYGIWLHIDGAYAGNSFVCPELRGPMKGIENAYSFNTNPNKFMLTNFDCSLLWVRNKKIFTQGLVVDPIFLKHSQSDKVIDFRHWSIPLSRRFRSLKLWFVLRMYGVEGIQNYVRNHCRLAKYFEFLVRNDSRFEICAPVTLGLTCFRLVSGRKQNELLLDSLNSSGDLHMIPATLGKKFILRFCVNAENITEDDIDKSWAIIQDHTSLVEKMAFEQPQKRKNSIFSHQSSAAFKSIVKKLMPEIIKLSKSGMLSEEQEEWKNQARRLSIKLLQWEEEEAEE